jgi:hypothetical protein
LGRRTQSADRTLCGRLPRRKRRGPAEGTSKTIAFGERRLATHVPGLGLPPQRYTVRALCQPVPIDTDRATMITASMNGPRNRPLKRSRRAEGGT